MRDATLQIYMAEPSERKAKAWAFLPPLALYAALALVLYKLFDTSLYVPALALGAAVIAAGGLLPNRAGLLTRLAAILGAVLAFALLPSVREGAMLLANRLYATSETVNAYAYDYFSVTAAKETRAIHAALLAAAAFGGAFCSFLFRRRAALVTLFIGVAFLEAYFGVTPEAWRNVLLFAVLALLLVREEAVTGNGAALLAGLAVVTLAVFLLAPRPNTAVETYSEHLRDELGVLAQGVAKNAPQPEEEVDRTHQESRQHEELAHADSTREQKRQEFERQTETEREIALPHRIDYWRIVLLLLAVVALLVVPFAPFLLLNRAKRRAAERRSVFESTDNAAAIRAMFAHTVDWLRACGLQTENRPFAQCAEAVRALMSDEYAARYAAAAAIWQEAAYSEHSMSGEQRVVIRALLEETEASLYEKADRKTRFRLKYMECLCEV